MKKYAIYTVCEISEDMDFGCEERPADVQRMAVVTLTDPKGASLQVKQPDDMLYEREIEEGDSVYFDLDGQLQKFHIIEEIENNLRGMADENLCIGCMRCLRICPVNTREVNAAAVAAKAEELSPICALRKENELFL